MQRFCVTRILQGGREYFVANYPANRKPWSRKAAGRAQRKFNRRELAEAFLEEAKRRVNAAGYAISNLDSTLILAQPKIGPYAARIRENLSTLLGIAPEQIGIKAKTPEGVGTENAAIAHAAVLLRKLEGPRRFFTKKKRS